MAFGSLAAQHGVAATEVMAGPQTVAAPPTAATAAPTPSRRIPILIAAAAGIAAEYACGVGCGAGTAGITSVTTVEFSADPGSGGAAPAGVDSTAASAARAAS
ncbi:hypothetical protein CJ468_05945 [Nocardia farcinica]|nr:hypothetical protein CJ468_05945 [Nocardia farcinica]